MRGSKSWGGHKGILAAAGACGLVLVGVAWLMAREGSDGPGAAPALPARLDSERGPAWAEAGPLPDPRGLPLRSVGELGDASEGRSDLSGSAVPHEARASTRLDGVLETFLTDRPDLAGFESELGGLIWAASVPPDAIRRETAARIHGEIALAGWDADEPAVFTVQGNRYRIELPILGRLEPQLAERRLILSFVRIAGRAENAIAVIRCRPRPGAALERYLEERRAQELSLDWRISFTSNGIQAVRTATLVPDPEGGAWTMQQGGSAALRRDRPGPADPETFEAWLRLIHEAVR